MLCWYKYEKTPFNEPSANYEKSTFSFLYLEGNFLSVLLWPAWWIFIFASIFRTKCDLIHVINYNSIFPALIAGKLKRKPVIYEIMDVTYDAISMPILFKNLIMYLDKIFMRFSDAVILVDENQRRQFSGIPNSSVSVIYDSAPDLSESISSLDKKQNNKVFVILYIGVLYKMRHLNIDKLCDVVQSIEDTRLIIAGYGDLVDDVKARADRSNGKIQFLGRISYSDALDMSLRADALIVLRDSCVRTNRYICGSKIWEAMMCGRPIIVNRGTSTADKVLKENCGLVIDANDINEISGAIMNLRDNPKLCDELGANGRRAYEERYSWDIMGQRLIKLYQNLTESPDGN